MQMMLTIHYQVLGTFQAFKCLMSKQQILDKNSTYLLNTSRILKSRSFDKQNGHSYNKKALVITTIEFHYHQLGLHAR